jgi:hypothetical protein
MSTLTAANTRWHQQLERLYQAFLESLTALELDTAHIQWTQFKSNLLSHIQFEEEHIEPLTNTWEDNILKLIQSDHLILNRLIPRLDKSFTGVQQADATRTELVHQLDIFIKMRNVLVHHDLRETEQLYPRLDQQLSIVQAQLLAEQMDRLLDEQDG